MIAALMAYKVIIISLHTQYDQLHNRISELISSNHKFVA